MWDQDNTSGSVIGEDLIVTGDIKSKSDLLIIGNVEGNITCVTLLVGKSGKVNGDITSENLVIEGGIQGMVSSASVELKDGCSVEGDITSSSLSIDHGAEFIGSVRPGKDKGKAKIKEAAE